MESEPLRLFVVEDSELIRRRIVENIRAMGRFEIVGVAESEDDAVDAIDKLHPDIVITDIRLKDGNGVEVVRRVCPHSLRPVHAHFCAHRNTGISARSPVPMSSSTSPPSTTAPSS